MLTIYLGIHSFAFWQHLQALVSSVVALFCHLMMNPTIEGKDCIQAAQRVAFHHDSSNWTLWVGMCRQQRSNRNLIVMS